MGATKVWKGHLSFGLLNIPVYLNVAARDKRMELNNFHVACDGRIKMPKYCSTCQVQLEPTEIYRGRDIGGKIVKLTDAELDSITPATDKLMTVNEIVPLKDVDPIYLAESFYLLPDDAGKKAYSLLVKTLTDMGSAAITQLTKSSREHVAVIRPRGNGLLLSYIWYESEIASVPEFENLAPASVTANEMKLARQLADSLVGEFNHSQFEDGYYQRLSVLIASKVDSSIDAPVPVKTVSTVASIDIMAALQNSMALVAAKSPKRKEAVAAKGKKSKAA